MSRCAVLVEISHFAANVEQLGYLLFRSSWSSARSRSACVLLLFMRELYRNGSDMERLGGIFLQNHLLAKSWDGAGLVLTG